MNNFDNLIIKKDECSICFNLIKKEIILNCNHYFCDNCIKEWVKRSNLCPMCRTHINFNLIPELIPIINRRRNRQIQNIQRQNNQRQNHVIQNYFNIKMLIYFLTFLLLFSILLKIFEEKMNNDNKNLNNTIENYDYNYNDNHY